MRISPSIIYCQKLDSLHYIFFADGWVGGCMPVGRILIFNREYMFNVLVRGELSELTITKFGNKKVN